MTKVYLTRDLGLAMISVSESIPLKVLKPVTSGFGNLDLVAPRALLEPGLPFFSRSRPSAWGLV